MKTDSEGNKKWERTFGGSDDDLASAVQPTADGGYVLAGSTDSYGAGDYDAWLIKVKGTTGLTEISDLTLSQDDIYFKLDPPTLGEPNTIYTTIHNNGNADARTVIVQFFDGNPVNGGTKIGNNQVIALITGGGSEIAQVDWAVSSITTVYVVVDPYDSIKESNEGNNVAYKQVSGVESSIYPIYDYINVDLMQGKIGFNDIKLYVGPDVNSVHIKELDANFQPDEQGNITLNHLHIYKILANGYNTTTLDFNGKEKKIDLLFSIDHLTDAEKKVFLEKHKDLTGFYQFDSWGGDYVYHDNGIPPSDLIINWSVEGQEIEKYYSSIDEMLRIIQFCILLSCDPDVKDYIESEIKLAKSQEKLTDDCEIYTEILRVLETMDAPMRCDIKIPEIKVVETYNILGEIDIITHTDQFFVDENLSLWMTVDNSDNPSDPGGVILHFQTNVFDLDTASGLIKMVIQAEDIAAESMIDIVSIALILSTGGGAAALEPILDQIGTLNDFVGFLAEYERSIISIFWDYTVDLSIPIIQEINPKPISNEENLREVTDALFNNINDVYFPLDSELTVGIARVQKDALESNCVAQPISRILDLGLVFDYTFALHFDSAVNPIEYERVITDLYQDVNTDFVYDWSFEYDIVDPVNPFERNEGSFGDEGTFNYDKKRYYPESILFKVEEFSVSDYIGKNIGAADVVFEYMTKLAAKLVANLIIKNVITPSADTFAKEVSEAIANELLKSIVKWIVEMVRNFVYETVKNIVADLLLVAIEDLIPADPITTDYYYCFSNTMPFIIPAPSNLFEIDFDNIPITFDQTVSLPLELGSFHIIGSLNVDLDMVEGGTQDDSHLLTIFAREYGEYRRLGSSFTVTTDGPVDIAVRNPDGLIFSKDSGPFSGCIYNEDDLDGEIVDELIIKGGKYGLYEISAIPETGADQNEIFSLSVSSKSDTISLAENVKISKIPNEPYSIELTDTGVIDKELEEKIARKYMPNIHQLECDIDDPKDNGLIKVGYAIEENKDEARIEYNLVFKDEDDAYLDTEYDEFRKLKYGRIEDIEGFSITVDLNEDAIKEIEFDGTWHNDWEYYDPEIISHILPIDIFGDTRTFTDTSDFTVSNGHLDLYVGTWNHFFSNTADIQGIPCDEWVIVADYSLSDEKFVNKDRKELVDEYKE